jgi:KDO2-lipid IV(A) lauroyltransferase
LSRTNLQRWLELLSRLSLGAQYRLATPLAALLAHTPNQVSRQARANIGLCFGDLGDAERHRLYRDAIRHTCYTMTELGAVWCWPVDRVLARIRSLDICDEFSRGERARIILVPHLGSWETLAVWLGRHCEAIMLYKRRKRKHRETDRYIVAARSRSGGTLVSTRKQGLRELLVGLKRGRSIVILPDQKPGGGKASIDSTFFGHSAPTTTLVQSLCSRIECDVFIASALRSAPPGEFDLCIRPLEHARLAADEATSAQYMNDAIEALVRTRPGQYQWGYRRFSDSVYAAKRPG